MTPLLDDIADLKPAASREAASAPVEQHGFSANAPLAPSSMVLDVEVLHRGVVHKASYFVEHGVIHAKIGGSIRLTPLSHHDAAAIVASQLTGYLLQRDRKREQVRIWHAGSGIAGR